jgi:hypothetical protein
VTAGDVRRVANTYFAEDQRNVMIIHPTGGAEGDAGAGEDTRYARAVRMIASIEDAAQLEQMIGMLSMRLEQIDDPEQKARMEELLEMANKRLEELRSKGNE